MGLSVRMQGQSDSMVGRDLVLHTINSNSIPNTHSFIQSPVSARKDL